jgi:hypothetical protein
VTVYVGGLRSRLVRDSLWHMINNSLTSLGWFSSGSQHRPITFLQKDIEDDEDIELNTLALVDSVVRDDEIELGSNYAEHRIQFFLDFYGESRAVSQHMAVDLKDILEGRMPSVGRGDSRFTVFDYTQATPVDLFRCDIDTVVVDRTHNPMKPFQRFWYSVMFSVVDTYGNENDA